MTVSDSTRGYLGRSDGAISYSSYQSTGSNFGGGHRTIGNFSAGNSTRANLAGGDRVIGKLTAANLLDDIAAIRGFVADD
jgi:hypothetical protein